MLKIPKHFRALALGIAIGARAFWSFEFVSFGIVSNFVLRYSNLQRVNENYYVGPFQGPSSGHQFNWW